MELASNVFSAPLRKDSRKKSFIYVPITENTIGLIREAYCKEVLLRKKIQNHTAGRSAQGWFQETKINPAEPEQLKGDTQDQIAEAQRAHCRV